MWPLLWLFFPIALCDSDPNREGYAKAIDLVYRGYLVGYTSRRSYLPGEQALFYLASSTQALTQCEVGMRYIDHPVASVPNVQIQSWKDDDCYNHNGEPGKGCKWRVAANVIIEESWPSSIYAIRCRGLKGSVDFVISANPPDDIKEEDKTVLYVTGSYTSLLYNIWGGRSGYGHFDGDGNYVTQYLPYQYLSWNRPAMSPATFGTDSFSVEQYAKHQFLYNYSAFSHRRPILSYVHEYPEIAEWDTVTEDRIAELGAGYLSKFKMLVFLGKYEYNTIPMWNEVRKFVRAGGKMFMKSHELMWAFIEDNGSEVYLNATNCYWWYNTCRGTEYSQAQSGFQWDLDFFGASFQYEVPANNYVSYHNPIVDGDHWVAKQLEVKKGKKAWWKSLDSKFNPHLKVKKGKDGKYCPVDGNIPCSNFTIIALSPSWAAKDPKDPKGKTIRIYAMLGVIRHGDGDLILVTHEFQGGDHKGLPVILAILNGKKHAIEKDSQTINTLGIFAPVVFLFFMWIGACTKRIHSRCKGETSVLAINKDGEAEIIKIEDIKKESSESGSHAGEENKQALNEEVIVVVKEDKKNGDDSSFFAVNRKFKDL